MDATLASLTPAGPADWPGLPGRPRPRPSAAIVLVVVLLHVALWWIWPARRQMPTPSPAADRGLPMQLRWIDPAGPAPSMPPRAQRQPVEGPTREKTAASTGTRLDPRAAPSAGSSVVPESQRSVGPAEVETDLLQPHAATGIAPPAAGEAPGPVPVPAPAPATASPPEVIAPRLQLDLPRRPFETSGSTRAQALEDPRSRTPRPTLETRFGAGISGTAGLLEESRGHGRWRYRSGQDCVELRDSRAAALDAFATTTRPMPKLGEDCTPP